MNEMGGDDGDVLDAGCEEGVAEYGRDGRPTGQAYLTLEEVVKKG